MLACDCLFVIDHAQPLTALWRWTHTLERSAALWGLVQESGDDPPLTFSHEMRDVRPASIPRASYYNTGVILLHAHRLRARNLTHPSQLLEQLSAGARHGKTRYDEFGLGEQNLLNAWLLERSGLVTTLPCRWNRRIDRPCDDASPGIRHANRMLAKPHDWEITDARLRQVLVGPLPPPDPPPDQLWARQSHAERQQVKEAATTVRRLSTSTGGTHSSRVSRYLRSRPHRACADEQLLPKWRGNATITAECVYLYTKYLARQDVRAWHERYRTLRCAIAAGRKSSRVEN